MNIIPKQPLNLPQLGWNNLFQQQLTLEELEHSRVARVVEHHRSGYKLLSEDGETTLAIHKSLPMMTVGDWLLLDKQGGFERLLDRQSLFARKAAGGKVAEQLIAANVSTLFIVCALNDDFNLSRIERYLATSNEAEVEPVIVLTKADLVTDAEEKRQQVQQLDPLLMVEMLNALDGEQYTSLSSWCKSGSTVAFMGSSGVGKSTLVNGLLGESVQLTGGIRESDSKGRHTTTGRSMHFLPSGGVLIDTPGMRELQLFDCADGVAETFSDIEALAEKCRFSDCQHDSEPGCAVINAIETGQLEQRRLNNYLKLMREQQRNSATLAERRASYKQQTKMYRNIQTACRSRKQSL
ncbi:ribosome small subunit-dependent GTPase A [Vibrio coralliilyticus]|uniref:ribosome small subunit-dependent GTPase A n=1 Tax=Vibrio coralliilyticus TaxID=190893 RepID=UPI001561A380|nr:ribosome small subunit-dependent GTPase A [Vibrio coralliilyticus]NRF30020.1 ribosome small subunit-dependent GTPase A [Vibrio coralliilyticus]NRF51172.1 ribosome small subunit-dependent GTPase A [Vibrio coralliilyticus]